MPSATSTPCGWAHEAHAMWQVTVHELRIPLCASVLITKGRAAGTE
jgi:hypothetical protein